MPAKANPVVVLADALVEAIRAERDRGVLGYPMRLSQLAQLAASDLFPKAIKHKSFTSRVLLAQKKNPDSLLVLLEDADKLAASDALLLHLLEQFCTPATPAIAVDKLVKKVEKPLQQSLQDSLNQRILSRTLPATVGFLIVKNKPQLYLAHMPPPRPADVELAEKLLALLNSRRGESAGFPWTMRGLIAEVAPNVDAKLLKKALGSKMLKPRLITAAKGDDAPVALIEDEDRLLASPGLLAYALNAVRTDVHQAIPLSDLKKKVSKPLQLRFAQSLGNRVARQQLPEGIGLLRIKKQPCFFFWSDVVSAAPAVVEDVQVSPQTVEFAAAFEQAFDSLDRQRGSINLVNLVELRKALPFDRATFDRELYEMRRANRFSLSGAEGRHGLSEEEREAAIREGDNLLLYVMRRR
jgi:hypothetical protein